MPRLVDVLALQDLAGLGIDHDGSGEGAVSAAAGFSLASGRVSRGGDGDGN